MPAEAPASLLYEAAPLVRHCNELMADYDTARSRLVAEASTPQANPVSAAEAWARLNGREVPLESAASSHAAELDIEGEDAARLVASSNSLLTMTPSGSSKNSWLSAAATGGVATAAPRHRKLGTAKMDTGITSEERAQMVDVQSVMAALGAKSERVRVPTVS